MAATTVSFTDKELYQDRPDIPVTKKITFGDVNALKAASNNHASLIDGNLTPTTATNDYTLVLTDTFVLMNKATAVNLTVPLNSSVAFPVGKYLPVMQLGAGTVTFVPAGGVTITASSGQLTSSGVNSLVGLLKTGTNTWQLINGNAGEMVDWSSGINPVGWTSLTTQKAYYIDYGKTVFFAFDLTGTGNAGTTASITLPVLTSSIYATMNGIGSGLQSINVTTHGPGMAFWGGSTTSCSLYKDTTGSGWTASSVRTIRGQFTYFK